MSGCCAAAGVQWTPSGARRAACLPVASAPRHPLRLQGVVMILRTIAALVTLGFASATLAQAPAAPAARKNIPMFCTNCHKADANEVFGAFEGAAFKSQSIQLKIDGATEIVRFDKNALKVIDAGE